MENLAFSDYRKNDIHGTVHYPAMMVAPVQKEIIQDLLQKENISSIFEPFHGSGTALYEAFKLDNSVKLVGCDINPLANLITRAKLMGVSNDIYKNIEVLKKQIALKKPDSYTFNNSVKWFNKDVFNDLKVIRQAIIKINNIQDRLYFWCLFSNIVRKYSNTRCTTYKLHIKSQNSIDKIINNVIEEFIESVTNNVHFYQDSALNFKLYKCDVLELLPKMKDDEFDLSITSPPYGDNLTTVTYGQFSSLALFFIDKKDLFLDGWELQSYSIIDSKSLGGSNVKRNHLLSENESNLIKIYLKQISLNKQKKVNRFFADYFSFLKQISRITNKKIVLTLGNRTVDGVNIDLNSITQSFFENIGWVQCYLNERNIPLKRIPCMVSCVNNQPVPSMGIEYIAIYKPN